MAGDLGGIEYNLKAYLLTASKYVDSMENDMETVTISPKYQVVIPRKVREQIGLRPGQVMQVFAYENRIELVPVRPIQDLRGFLQGIDTSVEREADRL